MNNFEERDDQRPQGGKFYRDDVRRITVSFEAREQKWIFYRDTWGFREGEFASAELAMAAANVNPASTPPKVAP